MQGWGERPDLQQQQVLWQQVQQQEDLAVQLAQCPVAPRAPQVALCLPTTREQHRLGEERARHKGGSQLPHPYAHPTQPKP